MYGKSLTHLTATVFLLAAFVAGSVACRESSESRASSFDGRRALALVERQMALGPRPVGSSAHAATQEWIRAELVGAGWRVREQAAEAMGHPIKNLVGFRGPEPARILVGAHYDTRLVADRDPDSGLLAEPSPGANDGASGVAVLLELARILPQNGPAVELVFFDAEDNGRIPGWDWVLGSTAYVAAIQDRPEAVVIVDMVGDRDLQLHYEGNSDPALRSSIWALADELGYDKYFIPSVGHSLLDDHTPFLEAGIPAVDIIDFDYPHWHTTQDTMDKLSWQSLEVVGETLRVWLASFTELPS